MFTEKNVLVKIKKRYGINIGLLLRARVDPTSPKNQSTEWKYTDFLAEKMFRGWRSVKKVMPAVLVYMKEPTPIDFF